MNHQKFNVLMFGLRVQYADHKASTDTEQYKHTKDADVHYAPNGIGAHEPAFKLQKTVPRYIEHSLR